MARYSEGIDLLYSRNRFCLDNLKTLEQFSKTILPRRLNLIRTIDIDASTDQNLVCYDNLTLAKAFTAGMPNLREVRIVNSRALPRHEVYFCVNSRASVQGLFEPLAKAKVTIIDPSLVYDDCYGYCEHIRDQMAH